MNLQSSLRMSGALATRVIRGPKAPLAWRIQNALKWSYISGWLGSKLVVPAAKAAGIATGQGALRIRARVMSPEERANYAALAERLAMTEDQVERDEIQRRMSDFVSHVPWKDYGVVGRRSVTNAGVTYMRDDFNAAAGSADITNFKFHASGSSSTGENVTDTALGSETPESRTTGTQGTGAGTNTYVATGTITYTGARAIVEHGLFSGSSAGTLWDRTVFSVINVAASDSIQFTYTLTITAGG